MDVNRHRRDRLDSQFIGEIRKFRFALDRLKLVNSFKVYTAKKYDTFEAGASIAGENRIFTTDDDWNEGTGNNVTVSGGTITATADGASWISPTLYWSNSSFFTTLDNFNSNNFNGEWSSSDVTFTFEDDLEAQGYTYLEAVASTTSSGLKISKTLKESQTMQDIFYILHRGNVKVTFTFDDSTTASFTTSGNPTVWTLSSFDSSAHDGKNITSVDLETTGDYYERETERDADGMEDWGYRREITITEQSGNDLTDYQVLIELDSSNFDFSKANSDGSDVRFTDTSGNSLSYWIEEWDSTGETAKIWVKVPSIPANSSVTLYMFYGKPDATSESDPQATMDVYDDFSSDTIASGYWTVSSGTAVITGGYIRLGSGSSGTGDVVTHTSSSLAGWNGGLVIKVKQYSETTGANKDWDYFGLYNSTGDAVLRTAKRTYENSDDGVHWQKPGDGWVSTDPSTIFGDSDGTNRVKVNQWYSWEITLYPNGNTTAYAEGNGYSGTISRTGYFTDFNGTVYMQINGGYHRFDDILIRKYTDPEPTVTVGTELPTTYHFFSVDAMWTEDTDRQTTWEQIEVTGTYQTIDILDASDDSVLISGLTGSTIDLKSYSELEGKNLKIRINMDNTDSVDEVKISWKPDLLGYNHGQKIEVT